MSDPEMSRRARWAATDELYGHERLNERAVTAAARIMMADELRRLAADPDNLFTSGSDTDLLLARAGELDPAPLAAPGGAHPMTGRPSASIVSGTEEISDGYHTFGELYAHRAALLVCLMSWHPHRSWYALRHADGTVIEGFLLAGMELPTGQISYHLRLYPWYGVLQPLLREYDVAPSWDDHTADDVLRRITAWTGAHPRPRSD